MENIPPILQDLRDIFAILHDGIITTEWTGDRDLLVLRVECEHLAERINPSFTSFFIEMKKIEMLEFYPWENKETQIIFTEISDIFNVNLMLLDAEIENGYVKIDCNENSQRFFWWGGTLHISCESVSIFNELKEPLTIDQLDEINKGYWDEVSKTTERYVLEEWRKIGRNV